jgi:glycosidase
MADLEALLAFLYGDTAGTVAARLLEAIRNRRQTPGSRRVPSHRDALLIAYPDQVTEPGMPPLRTLTTFLEERLGGMLSGVHVLPLFPSTSDDGFAITDLYAVDPRLGSWDDVEALAHRFELMLDAVFNHVSSRSSWFQDYLAGNPARRDWFIAVEGDPDLSQVVRPRATPLLTTFPSADGPRRIWTTFSADQVDLNLAQPEVLLALVEALLLYVERGASWVRLDAVAYLWKRIGTPCIHLPETHATIKLLRAILDRVAPHVLLVTETNVPHRDNISYFGDGHDEAQLVYNFALPPLVLHALVTGNAATLSEWAATLRTPSAETAFLNFLASHDGIGLNPVRGILSDAAIDELVQVAVARGAWVSEKQNPDGSRSAYELNVNYLDALTDPVDGGTDPGLDRFELAHAIMLAMPGVPALYFHSLLGSRGDREGATRSGIPRRVNREKLVRAALERELGDPSSRRSQVLASLGARLRARRRCPAFHPAGPWRVLTLDQRVFALVRDAPDGGERAVCLHNVTSEPVELELDSGVLQERPQVRLQPYEARWILRPANRR